MDRSAIGFFDIDAYQERDNWTIGERDQKYKFEI